MPDDSIVVEVPGLGNVEFPTGTSKDVMTGAIHRQLAKQGNVVPANHAPPVPAALQGESNDQILKTVSNDNAMVPITHGVNNDFYDSIKQMVTGDSLDEKAAGASKLMKAVGKAVLPVAAVAAIPTSAAAAAGTVATGAGTVVGSGVGKLAAQTAGAGEGVQSLAGDIGGAVGGQAAGPVMRGVASLAMKSATVANAVMARPGVKDLLGLISPRFAHGISLLNKGVSASQAFKNVPEAALDEALDTVQIKAPVPPDAPRPPMQNGPGTTKPAAPEAPPSEFDTAPRAKAIRKFADEPAPPEPEVDRYEQMKQIMGLSKAAPKAERPVDPADSAPRIKAEPTAPAEPPPAAPAQPTKYELMQQKMAAAKARTQQERAPDPVDNAPRVKSDREPVDALNRPKVDVTKPADTPVGNEEPPPADATEAKRRELQSKVEARKQANKDAVKPTTDKTDSSEGATYAPTSNKKIPTPVELGYGPEYDFEKLPEDASYKKHQDDANKKAYNVAHYAFHAGGIRDSTIFERMDQQTKDEVLEEALKHGKRVGNPQPHTEWDSNGKRIKGGYATPIRGLTQKLIRDHIERMIDDEANSVQ